MTAKKKKTKKTKRYDPTEPWGKHDPWGEDETYSREDWMDEVARQDTQRGYWDWVQAQKEEADDAE